MNNKSSKSCVAMLNCTLSDTKKEKRLHKNVSLFSRGDRIRTCDHLVPNQARYRTALHPVGVVYFQVPQLRNPLLQSERSRGDRIRTCDHLVPNQARYRTALHPVGVVYFQVPQLRNPLLQSERSRGDRIRTCDHLVPNQARYRTALHPVSKLRMQRYNYFLTQPKFNTCFFTKHHNNRNNNAR